MQKTYLRYVHDDSFGVIASPGTSIISDPSGQFVYTSAVHEVIAWDLRQGTKIRRMAPADLNVEVTSLTHGRRKRGVAGPHLAAGYSNGSVHVYDASEGGSPSISFVGHRGAVLSLALDQSETCMASGGADTDIVLWDLVAEQGLFRLKGHKDAVTAVTFVNVPPSSSISGEETIAAEGTAPPLGRSMGGGGLPRTLVSCSKDTLVKVWELATRHCLQTIVGHRAEVWSLAVSPCGRRLLSGSADEQLRVWDLSALALDPPPPATEGDSGTAPLSSPTPMELSLSSPGWIEDKTPGDVVSPDGQSTSVTPPDQADGGARFMGGVKRVSTDRCTSIQYHRISRSAGDDVILVGVKSSGKVVEVFQVRSKEDATKKLKRRLKRQREKAAQPLAQKTNLSGEGGDLLTLDPAYTLTDAASTGELGEDLSNITAADELQLVGTLRSSVKISSFAFLSGRGKNKTTTTTSVGGGGLTVSVALALQTNAIEVYAVPLSVQEKKKKKKGKKDKDDDQLVPPSAQSVGAPVSETRLDIPGHRGEARAVALSSDASMVATVGSKSVKIWNVESRQCTRTAAIPGLGLCVAWLPDDRYVAVGTKEGVLLVLSLNSGEIVQSMDKAHDGAIWALDVDPQGRAELVSASADHELKFWDVNLDPEDGGGGGDDGDEEEMADEGGESDEEEEMKEGDGAGYLTHRRTLKMGDDVLAARFTQPKDMSKALIAVATLDSTVRIFFRKNLKFFLQLYGHKLPVLALDVADDSSMIATGSADKTVKIWGLDFGDCHKSLLAHSDSVTALKFIAETHYFLTASKDRSIKYWDGDHFELILVLDGHRSEVWSLSVAYDGSTVVSAGHDQTLRMWKRTDEPVFLDEEKDLRLESGFEDELNRDDRHRGVSLAPTDGKDDGIEEDEQGRASRRTMESVKAAERLLESLDIAEQERKAIEEHEKTHASKPKKKGSDPAPVPPRRPSPLLLNLDPSRYMLRCLRMIKAAELEEALLVLPFHMVTVLAAYLLDLLQKGLEIEVCVRCAIFLVQLHHDQLASSGDHQGLIRELQTAAHAQVQHIRDRAGVNLAALRALKRACSSDHDRVPDSQPQTDLKRLRA